LQQPFGHVVFEHGGGAAMHAWFEHVSDDVVQSTHALPPMPHAVSSTPAEHVPAEQHPPAQFSELHPD